MFQQLHNTKTTLQATLATLHRPQLRHFMHYDPFMNENMATTNAAKVPETAIIPPTPSNGEHIQEQLPAYASPIADSAGIVTENPVSPASIGSPTQSPQERRLSATEVIDAVLAEDEAKNRTAEAPATKSRTSSRSRSRSRPTSAADSRRGSTSVWDNDPEKKQRKLVEKIFGHRWTPDFLK